MIKTRKQTLVHYNDKPYSDLTSLSPMFLFPLPGSNPGFTLHLVIIFPKFLPICDYSSTFPFSWTSLRVLKSLELFRNVRVIEFCCWMAILRKWSSYHQDHSSKTGMIWLHNRFCKGNICRHRGWARWLGSYIPALTVMMKTEGFHCGILLLSLVLWSAHLVWIWANYFVFLGFGFLLCKVKIITTQISGDNEE